MAFTTIQTGFVSGELSPELFGRPDLAKYHTGCSTMRNFFVNYQGGASSRAGFAYCGMCKQGAPNVGGTATANPPRSIRFQYSINQGFNLEFGDQYMRIVSDGSYVLENGFAITAMTQADPVIITVPGHDFVLGDWVYIAGVQGMTNLNSLIWVVSEPPSSTQITVESLFGAPVDSVSFPAYISGGTVKRIYTVVSPYTAVDLPYLKFTQDANVMTLTCVNQQTLTEYPPYDLQRVTDTDWVFTQTTYAAVIGPPQSIAVTAQSSTTLTTWYSYVVTAVDASGNESIASAVGLVQNNDIAVNAGSNTITWGTKAGAVSYNIYAATPAYGIVTPIGASFGYAGTAFGTQFTDTNITPDYSRVPPVHQNPFARGPIIDVLPVTGGSGYTQALAGYTINTSTGSGFAGFPIIATGALAGFYIADNGHDYAPGDTITITGGSVPATAAHGAFALSSGIPGNGLTITLNGVTWTFVSTSPTGNQTLIRSTLAATTSQLAADLGASAVANIAVASYSAAGNVLTIAYNTTGAGGNSYTLANGTYSGTVSGPTLTGGSAGSGSGGGATATLSIGPQTGTYPGVANYFEQRRGYAYTLDEPDTYFFSQPGAYTNMDYSTPTSDSDAIIGTPWGQQINGIQWMIPMPNGLVILTGNGGWLVSGINGGAFTPASQTAIQQANVGCSAFVPPILINSDILFVQSKNSIVRDLTYNFFTNIYMGEDKTILANHLVFGHTIIQWAYAEEPYKIIWAVRDDGILLSLTWLKEQDIWGWARHDTNGLVVNICSVTEPPVDAVYVIVKRYIGGQWVYYQERADNRQWQTIEDCFCVDAGLSYPMSFPTATLTPAAAVGTSNLSAATVIFGGAGYTNPVATARDSTGAGSGATLSVILSDGVIISVTPDAQGMNYTPGYTDIIIVDPTGSGAVVAPVITNEVAFTSSASIFSSANIGDVIRAGGGKATVTQFNGGMSIIADITQPITQTIPNDPSAMPVPITAGSWSIATPTTVVSGLNHLEGKIVSILADGSVAPQQVVTNGAITLPNPASAIAVGLPFLPQLQTMYLDPHEQPMTAQSKRKTIPSVAVRVQGTRGIFAGADQPDASTQPGGENVPWANMTPIKDRPADLPGGDAIPPFTGDEYLSIISNWNTKGQIAIQQPDPLPANILAIVSYYATGDTAG